MAAAGLTGWVRNQSGTVRLVIDGPSSVVDRLLKDVKKELPPKARLEGVEILDRTVIQKSEAAQAFKILKSTADRCMRISIPADLSICPDCRREILDPDSRFYRYPFTTCTNCGPRYTVVESMPYDRERTALKDFPLCGQCKAEYSDPQNRRYHAESIACPACGPKLFWAGPDGTVIPSDNPLEEARKAISKGKIVAVRGLGGFLLVADAAVRKPLEELRRRKNRPAKPFAVMACNMEVLEKQCLVSETERGLLSSSEAPIVILRTRPETTLPVDLLAPGLGNLGVMLPTTPLHELLAGRTGSDSTESFEFLLMTSGNRSGEPICVTNSEAFQRLRGIADFFLCHDRGINLRNDDSLAVVNGTETQLWRRARGYAPESIMLPRPLQRTVLAMGAELKNTICLGFGNEAVLSPHTGDLETPEAMDGLELVTGKFPEYFGRIPEVIAVDLNPDMHSSVLGRKVAGKLDIPVTEIQHHYAHAMSVMCEHRLEESIALVFDGTGLGPDGSIWGGELLHVHRNGWERLGTLAPAELIGGDSAVLRPALQLITRFWQLGLRVDERWAERLGVSEYELSIWKTQYEKRINSFSSHAAGRVFDAFSAGTGISPRRISYEGQAAILMEASARRCSTEKLPELGFSCSDHNGLLVADFKAAFKTLHEKCPREDDQPAWAAAFHNTMVNASLEMIEFARLKTGHLPVVLSGGVMMNRYFTTRLVTRLKKRNIEARAHCLVPPNDGGISLGQVYATGRIG